MSRVGRAKEPAKHAAAKKNTKQTLDTIFKKL